MGINDQEGSCASELDVTWKCDRMQDVCAGWLNVLGQLALTASTAYLVAIHLSVMFMVSNGHQLETHELFLTYASKLS